MTAKWRFVGAEIPTAEPVKTYLFARDVVFMAMIGRTVSRRVSRVSIQQAIGALIGPMSTPSKDLVAANLISQLWRRVAAT
jgi:hypothetical protein